MLVFYMKYSNFSNSAFDYPYIKFFKFYWSALNVTNGSFHEHHQSIDLRLKVNVTLSLSTLFNIDGLTKVFYSIELPFYLKN